jgi:hypothetical protein
MIQIEKGLPRRQLRIQNKKRFIVFLIIISLPIMAILIPDKADSQVSYKPYTVGYREYYWHVAKRLQDEGYKKDIRDIVDELVRQSGIPAHELMEGDTIYIPDMEGVR